MTPILICAYQPRYLRAVLGWFRSCKVEEKYRIFVWDNGGASAIFKEFGLQGHRVRNEGTDDVINIGKALAVHYLIDIVNREMPDADCYVCMDDDIIVDLAHLDALVAAARRSAFGMIAPRFHPFNSVVPQGGAISPMDPCPTCASNYAVAPATPCVQCKDSRKDARGLHLHIYPKEDRTVHNKGRIAGGLFAISKASIGRLPWAPHVYPILTNKNEEPIVYWTEDATLDAALTTAGLINGYLAGSELTPVLHLPELNEAYKQWKLQAQDVPTAVPFNGF